MFLLQTLETGLIVSLLLIESFSYLFYPDIPTSSVTDMKTWIIVCLNQRVNAVCKGAGVLVNAISLLVCEHVLQITSCEIEQLQK
jgi:hypothetical protein